jgi:hypothetical protein
VHGLPALGSDLSIRVLDFRVACKLSGDSYARKLKPEIALSFEWITRYSERGLRWTRSRFLAITNRAVTALPSNNHVHGLSANTLR